MTIPIMNNYGSFSLLSTNMEPGLSEPFEVILQLHVYVHFGGRGVPRVFIRFSQGLTTQEI